MLAIHFLKSDWIIRNAADIRYSSLLLNGKKQVVEQYGQYSVHLSILKNEDE